MPVKGKFESYPEDIHFPICNNCKNNSGDFKCKAFPDGIPDDILDGENDHTNKHPEQRNEIVFEEKEK